jgi:hypothetical protein
MKKVIVPSGIGDILWVLQKLGTTGEKFHFMIPDGSPQRGHQILDLMPHVAASREYISGYSYSRIYKENVIRMYQQWKMISLYDEFALSANHHLERGRRIEDLILDLPTHFQVNVKTSADDRNAAEAFLAGVQPVGIYTSAYGNARHSHYNGWGDHEWHRFTTRLFKELGSKHTFIVIGAPYDSDLCELVMHNMEASGVPHKALIGYPLGVVVEVLKRLRYFVGFPSGLSILNELLGKDGTMFYGPRIGGIMRGWAHPERLKNWHLHETLFCDPDTLIDRLKNKGVLERI